MNYDNIFNALCKKSDSLSDEEFAAEYRMIENAIPAAIIHRYGKLNQIILSRVNTSFQEYSEKVMQDIPWYKFFSRYKAIKNWRYDGCLPVSHIEIEFSFR
jgi:hypothetical protein